MKAPDGDRRRAPPSHGELGRQQGAPAPGPARGIHALQASAGNRTATALIRSLGVEAPAASGAGAPAAGWGRSTALAGALASAAATVQRRRRKGADQARRTRSWALFVHSRVPDAAYPEVHALCAGVTGTGLTPVDLTTAASLVAGGWRGGDVARLARRFAGNRGGLLLADWVAIAHGMQPLVDQPAAVASLARTGGGWLPPNLAGLARLFSAGGGGRSAGDWVAVARGHAVLANAEADVAVLARVANGWTASGLATLAGRFGAASAGFTAHDWAQLAGAHVALGDQPALVAAVAAGGWTAAELGPFVARLVAGGADATAFRNLFALPGTAAAAHAVIGGPVTASVLGDFVGVLLNGGAGVPLVATMLTTAGVDQAAGVMVAAGWTGTDLGRFAAAALGPAAAATPAQLVAQMATPGFGAGAAGLVQGTWTTAFAGLFSGGAATTNVAPGDLTATAATAGMPAALESLTAAGLDAGQVGRYAGTARQGGVPDAYLLDLLQTPGVPAALALLAPAAAAPWTHVQLGELTVGAHGEGIVAATLGAVVAQAGFPGAAHPWAPTFTHTAVGQIVARMSLATANPVQIRDFLATNGAVAAAAAVHAGPRWTAPEIGRVAGTAATVGSPPANAQLVSLLDEAARALAAPFNANPNHFVQMLRAAGCGAPTWANVVSHAPFFRAYTGPANGAGAGVHFDQTLWFAHSHGGYHVRQQATDWIRHHVEDRHTPDHHNWSYASIMRQGMGGGYNLTFLNAGTNVPNEIATACAAAWTLANNVAWMALGGYQAAAAGGYQMGMRRHGAAYAWPHGNGTVYPVEVRMMYPIGRNQMVDRDVVAIGRLLGLTW